MDEVFTSYSRLLISNSFICRKKIINMTGFWRPIVKYSNAVGLPSEFVPHLGKASSAELAGRVFGS